jgi:hypothetical protein
VNKPYLLTSILALVATCHLGTPAPAYGETYYGSGDSNRGNYTIDPADVTDFAAKDLNRLRGNVVRAVVQKSPYVDVLDGGTLESGISDTQRVVIQERAVLNQSLVRPTFTLDREVCGTVGPAAEVGSTEYTYELSTNRGMGPLVCIKGMWSAFKTAYSAAEQSLRGQLVQLNNADVRITLFDRSGSKMVIRAATSFSDMFDGTMQAIDTPFPNVGLPNAMPNMKVLQFLARMMRETLLVEPWEGRSGPVMKIIGSQEVIDYLRDDAEVRDDHRYIAAGSYDIGKNSLLRYEWEGPYRGLAFGVDPQPLRFNTLNGSAQPVYIEPEIAVEVDNQVGSRPNPLWVHAKFEGMLMIGRNSFRKLAPETYTGEGSFKFPSQGVSGELMWRNLADNDRNVWQDFGRHYYQFSRAYKPERPHAVCAITFARKQTDFGLSAITEFGDWSATGSL